MISFKLTQLMAFVALLSLFSLQVVSAYPFTQSSDYPYGKSDVSVIKVDTNYDYFVSHAGFSAWKESVNVTLAVSNKNFKKAVGIRYSSDDWVSFQETSASYVATDLNNGFERWTLYLDLGNHDSTQPPFEVQLAGFVSYNSGPRSWDPNNNYFVSQKADPNNPLVLLNDGLQYDVASGNIVFSGLIRAYPYDRSVDFNDGVISVHWTTDNWKTIQDTPATLYRPQEYDWSFSVNIGSKTSIPATFTYVFKYNSSAGQKWLNNNGGNFQRQVAPVNYGFTAAGYQFPNNGASFNGIAQVGASFSSELPITDASYTLDGKPVHDLSNLNSTLLGDGDHAITATVYFTNSTDVASTISTKFTVKNSLQFLNEWIPTKPAGSPADLGAWGAKNVAGKIYVGFEHFAAARYSKFGTPDTPEITYTLPAGVDNSGYVTRITVDEATGSVYLLSNFNSLYKFFSNGTLDANFGTKGKSRLVLDSTQTYGTSTICDAWDVEVVQSNLILVDSCNARLLKFSPTTGEFQAEQKVPQTGNLATNQTVLYMTQGTSIATYNPSTLQPATGPNTVYTPAAAYNGIQGFVVTSGRVYIASSNPNFVAIADAKTGVTLGEFDSFARPAGPATFDVIRDVILLDDGSIAVLGVGGARFERFNGSV